MKHKSLLKVKSMKYIFNIIESGVVFSRFGFTVRVVCWKEDTHTCLDIWGQAQESDHVSLDLRCHSVVEAMAEPDAQLVYPPN